MSHAIQSRTNHASRSFWAAYRKLPLDVRRLALKNYRLFRTDPSHPSLHFKKVGTKWSVRVGLEYRALAISVEDGLLWVWIGAHDEYDRLLKK